MENRKMREAMEKGKRLIALIVILLISLISLAGTSHAVRQDIILAEFNWPASMGITHIMKQILQNRLDVRVSIIPLSQDVGWRTLERGVLDAAAEMWWPQRAAQIDEYVHERQTVAMSLTYENARQGILIPTWVSQRYNITDIDSLRQNADLFDISGDGKGDIWAGSSEWSSTEIMQIKVRDYNLNLDPYTNERGDFLARFRKAMEQEQPIAFYYWTPEWLFSQYDLTWIREPAYDPEKWKYIPKELDQSKITCEFQPAKIYTIFSQKLKDRVPKAYQLFKNFYIPIDEVNFIIAEIENIPGNPKKDAEKVAEKWIEDHSDIVNDWLKGIE